MSASKIRGRHFLFDMLQNFQRDCMCHQRRNSITYLSLLGRSEYTAIAAGGSFTLEYKAIIKRLEAGHLSDG